MERSRTRGLVLAGAGILLSAGIVLGLILMVNAEAGFAGCTGTTQFGWMAPILAASIIGGLAWILLGQDARVDQPRTPEAVSCPACGREVLGMWRLCPHCGTMLDGEKAGRSTPESD